MGIVLVGMNKGAIQGITAESPAGHTLAAGLTGNRCSPGLTVYSIPGFRIVDMQHERAVVAQPGIEKVIAVRTESKGGGGESGGNGGPDQNSIFPRHAWIGIQVV